MGCAWVDDHKPSLKTPSESSDSNSQSLSDMGISTRLGPDGGFESGLAVVVNEDVAMNAASLPLVKEIPQ